MSNENTSRTIDIVWVGVFAAVTYLGIQFFRIPLPAAVGAPFLHFGNIFFLLSVLLLGSKKGALAGGIGFILFDILNGYITVIPKVAVLTLLMAFAAGSIFKVLGKKYSVAVSVAIATMVAFLISLAGDFLYDTLLLVLSGSKLMPAMWAAFTSLLATAINSIFGIVAITVLYSPLRYALEKVQKER